MKGKHISRKTQRRLTKPKQFHLMSLKELLDLRDIAYDLEYKHGHTKAKERFPQQWKEGFHAMQEIKFRFPFGGYS